jgi:hypothetical protein
MDVCSVAGLIVSSMGLDYSTGEAYALTMLYHVLQLILYLQMERSTIISELKPLTAQNKRYNEVVAEKLKEMELPQNRLGMFLKNDDMQAQRAGFCSSVEELEQTVCLKTLSVQHPRHQ